MDRADGRTLKARARRRSRRWTLAWRWARLAAIVAIVVGVGVGIALTAKVRREHQLPLKDESIIKVQAREKRLDPALIAAVIYAETKFVPRRSSAGAEGLMQILPSTAHFLAKLSGGKAFITSDLSNPEINIAYGSYYLRYLLDHYEGDELYAVAAYNAGLTNVDAWRRAAAAQGRALALREIPFSETREYVRRVLAAQVRYRSSYATQLGTG